MHDDGTAPSAAASRFAAARATSAAAATGGGAAAIVDGRRAVPHGLRRPVPDRLLLRRPRYGDLPHHHHVRDLRLLRLLPTDAADARPQPSPSRPARVG